MAPLHRDTSPEQARGEAVGVQSDVYSLGAILFEILVGAPLLKTARTSEILAAVATGSGRQALPADVPEDLRQIVHRALMLAPAGRFQDAGALALAVQDWLDGAMARERALWVVDEALALQVEDVHVRGHLGASDNIGDRRICAYPPFGLIKGGGEVCAVSVCRVLGRFL